MEEYPSLDVTHSQIHKENIMEHGLSDKVENIFRPQMGGLDGGMGMGGGLGAGLLGGILGGTLLNRNGLLGNNGDGAGFVTPAMLTSALNGVTESNNTTQILQTLGDIKGSIPLAEGQVQLALAGAQNDINAQINSSTGNILNNQTGLARDIANSTATILASQNAIEDTIQNGIASVNLGIANLATSQLQNTYALNTAIRDDGDKTRGLIVAQNDANLQRMLTVAESQLAEQRAIGRSREVEVNVSQTVSQNQNQIQLQNQQQQQFQILANLSATVANLANDIQVVRQSQTIFNSGTMAGSGTQAAANTRVS